MLSIAVRTLLSSIQACACKHEHVTVYVPVHNDVRCTYACHYAVFPTKCLDQLPHRRQKDLVTVENTRSMKAEESWMSTASMTTLYLPCWRLLPVVMPEGHGGVFRTCIIGDGTTAIRVAGLRVYPVPNSGFAFLYPNAEKKKIAGLPNSGFASSPLMPNSRKGRRAGYGRLAEKRVVGHTIDNVGAYAHERIGPHKGAQLNSITEILKAAKLLNLVWMKR